MLPDDKILFNKISAILNCLKIPARLQGFGYLRSAVVHCYQSDDFFDQINNKLYPIIAQEFSTTQEAVEHCIRNCIQKSVEMKGYLSFNLFLNKMIYTKPPQFKSGDFIFAVVEILNLQNMKSDFLALKEQEFEMECT